ncbi:MAG: acetyl-CoA C-acyltransferase FadI [Proteobacteria bacterium]|nr:acetyl-CoA C-acyltransferase FadI [Pseudomonadota bacterium]
MRIALIDGVRTPFVKSWADYNKLSALDLARRAVQELIERSELDINQLDEIVMGAVLSPTRTPNIAREIVISLGLPKRIPGFTLGRACASGLQAVTSAAESMLAGKNQVVIAGGTESLSNVPVQYSKNFIQSLMAFQKARTVQQKMAALGSINPKKDLLPQPPELTEVSTGRTMGQHAEEMARQWGITREAQDAYAMMSHQRAAAAVAAGRFNDEVAPVLAPPDSHPVTVDSYVRADTTVEQLGKLKPAFDRKYGTLTAGNSSGLTDGASAVLLMTEDKAKALGYTPLAYIKGWAYAALDPEQGLLMGPSYATPKVLDDCKLKLSDIDLVDMHEAFAAQVLCNLKAWESPAFAKEKLGRDMPLGAVDMSRFNVNGGSIALGHPFGATGGRMLVSTAHELKRRNGRYALLTLCAAGAMGVSMVIER